MSYFYQNPLIIVAILTILLSPFVLKLASNQGKKTKQNLKYFFIFILLTQILLGFFNWENFTAGRSGFELSITYPQSFLGLFFAVTIVQIILLFLNQKLYTFSVILNFINTIAFFAGMIRIGQITSIQVASFASIGTVFAVLIGNVIGLIFINRDKNLLKKYAGQKGFSFIPLVVIISILVIGIVLDLQRDNSLILNQLAEVGSTKISRGLAVENVKKLPEVQEYLKNVPNGKVEVDNELEGEYNVHVYEVKNGYTATFNWYSVSIKSGEVRSEFPAVEENTGSTKITTDQATMVVQNLPEVQTYLKNVPNGKVEVDNEQEGEYNVHVYEVKNGHTATFNWYTVDIKTGKPIAQFDMGKAEETSTAKGTVKGKLCYPSEVIPEGTIEAKRLSDGKVFILDYGGSESGESNIYEFPLENGDYYLRYKTKGSFGYSTTVCPTGKEETCGDTKMRILRRAAVKTGQSISDYDLCDYYYKDTNAPKF